MCGIAGILANPNHTLTDLPERLAAMAQVMLHRGPDDGGQYVSPDGRAGLANRRLAIRDLSPAGHMPMSNAEGDVWITYNGEIYNAAELRAELERLNYRFRSSSDTEVILHGYQAWGEGVLPRLRGMFAFAILDQRPATPHGAATPNGLARLFLARDRLGIKPLYYAWTTDAFVFASELKGIQASGLVGHEISPAGLVGYLMLGSVPNPWTIYRDVQALEPACSLTIALDHPIATPPVPYWQMPTDTVATTKAEAVEQVRALLAESVRVRLVSDVPLGAFLSGGLDSSAVVALMRQATTGTLRTCSMVFEESTYSEAPYARAMAEAVGAEHYERTITVHDLADAWDRILAAMDQPSIDGVNTYFVSQTAREAGLTVALSGLGGDELFGGYPNTFRGVPQMLRALQLVNAIPAAPALARAAVGLWPDYRRDRIRDALRRSPSPASAYLTRRGLFSSSEVQALVSPDLWQQATQDFDPVQHIAARADGQPGQNSHSPLPTPHSLTSWVSRAELRTYTHHQLLRDTDVMSMAHSLEVRVPLLDHRLVEAVLRLPGDVVLNGAGTPKPLLAEALGDRLPSLVSQRQGKQGFTFPFALWLRGALESRAEAVLRQVQGTGWLQPAAVDDVFQAHHAGRAHWARLWAFVALGTVV
jgi:asparagine synthase (glutamine-hydrolysing)